MKTLPRTFSISVKELIEFSLQTGDLEGGDGVFSPTRALEGIRGHQRIQDSRPDSYEPEVNIQEVHSHKLFHLTVQGRMDGLFREENPVVIEEIKTVLGTPKDNPNHLLQLKMYGAMYGRRNQLDQIGLQLTLLHLSSGAIHETREIHPVQDLSLLYQQAVEQYKSWLEEYCRWLVKRDASVQTMTFPFPFRSGQKKFIQSVSNAIRDSHHLFAEAPTGMGKTLSTLFPSIEAMGHGQVENIFYLTAKTPGRTIAEKALSDMRRNGLHIRAITLTARDKLCQKEGVLCDPELCPLLKGHHDRIKMARKELFKNETLNRNCVESIASSHQLCPHEVSKELMKWCDVIIGDYNHVFDPTVYLRSFFSKPRGEYLFLVDEAHNLPDRARDMFSAELLETELNALLRLLGKQWPLLTRSLRRMLDHLTGSDGVDELFKPRELPPVSPLSPEDLILAVKQYLLDAGDWLARNPEHAYRSALLEFHFRCSHFFFVSELYDERYVTLSEGNPGNRRIRLFCMDPSIPLRQALERARSAIFFSATLTPLDFYKTVIGGNDKDQILSLPSPFPSENLGIMVADFANTTWQKRAGSYRIIAQSIGQMIQSRVGNYLAFFPSHDYLRQILEHFTLLYPTVRLAIQKPHMPPKEREAFLEKFQDNPTQTLVGFGVMGGVFGEGIDLVGDKLIGSIIIGVGLPGLCVERDVLKDYYTRKELPGFDFAYTFPGMNRVLQAVGRVIRTEEDRGMALLLDSRFSEPRYRTLFPEWWKPIRALTPTAIPQLAQNFWTGKSQFMISDPEPEYQPDE